MTECPKLDEGSRNCSYFLKQEKNWYSKKENFFYIYIKLWISRIYEIFQLNILSKSTSSTPYQLGHKTRNGDEWRYNEGDLEKCKNTTSFPRLQGCIILHDSMIISDFEKHPLSNCVSSLNLTYIPGLATWSGSETRSLINPFFQCVWFEKNLGKKP